QTQTGATQQFSENTDSGIVWSVNGIDGGNSTYGTISTTGRYAAPATVPTPSSFRICARLSTNASLLACAKMTVVPVVLSPPTLTAISPPDGNQGSTVNVTLTGTNFV